MDTVEQVVLEPTRTRVANEIQSELDPHSEIRVVSDARRRYRVLSIGLAVADVIVLVLSLMVGDLLRYGAPTIAEHLHIMLIQAPLIWLGVFYAFGLYSSYTMHPAEEIRRIAGAVGAGIAAVMILAFLPTEAQSRLWIGTTLLIALTFEIGARMAFRRYYAGLRRTGRLSLRTMVVGKDEEDLHRVEEILRTSQTGFAPVASLHTRQEVLSMNGSTTALQELRLRQMIRSYGTDCIFLTSTNLGPLAMQRICRVARQESVQVRVLAEMRGVLSSRISVQSLDESSIALALKPAHLSKRQALAKRAFDIGTSLLGLILTAPILLVTALAVRLDSKGPVLFRQERVTRGGRTFQMIKFRTMRADADTILQESGRDPNAAFFKWENDPRITRVGRFLRKTSLDELPQLFNVLLGTMSLIGPRPLPVEQVTANAALAPRHEVAAGITGWWQINGRSDVDPMTALDMDLFYIENWSPALDVYVLLKTVQVVFGRHGAF